MKNEILSNFLRSNSYSSGIMKSGSNVGKITSTEENRGTSFLSFSFSPADNVFPRAEVFNQITKPKTYIGETVRSEIFRWVSLACLSAYALRVIKSHRCESWQRVIRGGEKAPLRGNRLPGLHNRTTRVRINRRESSLWLGQSRYGKITILRLIFMPEVRGRRVIYKAFHLKTSKKMTQTTESSRISLKETICNNVRHIFPYFFTYLRNWLI